MVAKGRRGVGAQGNNSGARVGPGLLGEADGKKERVGRAAARDRCLYLVQK